MGLIAVGAGLRAMRLDESPAMMGYWLAVKLLVLPVIAWGVGRGLGLNDIYLTSVIVLAALPARVERLHSCHQNGWRRQTRRHADFAGDGCWRW